MCRLCIDYHNRISCLFIIIYDIYLILSETEGPAFAFCSLAHKCLGAPSFHVLCGRVGNDESHRIGFGCPIPPRPGPKRFTPPSHHNRSEEHTSELQSRQYLESRLLLEKKNITHRSHDLVCRTMRISRRRVLGATL